MNIHLPAILMFTRGTRFWPIPKSSSQTCDICPRKVASVTNWCWSFPSNKNYLVGGIPTPLKIWKSIGMIIPNIWKVIKLYKIPWFQTTNQLLIQTALWRTFPVRSFAEKHTEQLAVRQSSNANLGDCWYLFILYNHLFISHIPTNWLHSLHFGHQDLLQTVFIYPTNLRVGDLPIWVWINTY